MLKESGMKEVRLSVSQAGDDRETLHAGQRPQFLGEIKDQSRIFRLSVN